MKHLGTKTLRGERLILRPFTTADAPDMFNNWAHDPLVTKFMTWPTHQSLADSENIIDEWVSRYDEDDFYNWAIVLRDNDTLVGSIGAVQKNDAAKLAHIGYCIGQKWWHMGITSEALGMLIRFFFEEVGLNRVEARHDPKNPHSGQVMRKCGMKYEGTLRQADWNNQGICDAAIYAILAEDYE